MNNRISDLPLITTPVGLGYNNMNVFRNSLGELQVQLAAPPLGLDGSIFLKGCNLVDKLFSLREKEINRKIEGAKDDCERRKAEAEIKYENYCKELGEKDVDYRRIINGMLECKQEIMDADETLKVIAEVEADHQSEAELEEEKEK